MNDTPQTSQSGVSAMIANKLSAPAGATNADERKKFIIYLETSTNEKLANLAKVTMTGKIELASQLFSIAVEDAIAQCIRAGKLDPSGKLIEVAPAVPTESTVPSVPATTAAPTVPVGKEAEVKTPAK